MARWPKGWHAYCRAVALFSLIWIVGAGLVHARGGHGYTTSSYAPHPSELRLLVAEHRSREVPRGFQKTHPCPSTGATSGACPGHVRDHIVPLCAGCADATWNMQWQTIEAGKAKEVTERQACRQR